MHEIYVYICECVRTHLPISSAYLICLSHVASLTLIAHVYDCFRVVWVLPLLSMLSTPPPLRILSPIFIIIIRQRWPRTKQEAPPHS